jgi:hypothetical protein
MHGPPLSRPASLPASGAGLHEQIVQPAPFFWFPKGHAMRHLIGGHVTPLSPALPSSPGLPSSPPVLPSPPVEASSPGAPLLLAPLEPLPLLPAPLLVLPLLVLPPLDPPLLVPPLVDPPLLPVPELAPPLPVPELAPLDPPPPSGDGSPKPEPAAPLHPLPQATSGMDPSKSSPTMRVRGWR